MSIKVLIIEDNFNSPNTLFELLWIDFDVKMAVGSQNVFISIEKYRPDVIIIVCIAEINNGLKLCSSIKLNPHTSNVPVIIVSEIPILAAELKASYCNELIINPFSRFGLKKKIHSCCIHKPYYDI